MTEIIREPIQQRTFIAAPPERVYDTITRAEAWDAFFTTGMELDPRPGGNIVFRWKNWGPDFYTLEAPGKVVEARRPECFAFQWGQAPTTIRFELTAAHGGTVVHLTEQGYANTPEGRKNMLECACGWGEAVTLLKFYMEHGVTYTPPGRGA
jgi:uncharacterized protein YndB with AHSA1/START domain